MWSKMVPHPHVLDKNSGGISWESQTHTRPPAQDSRARKVSPHNFWLQKLVGIKLVEETAGAPSTSSDSLPLSSSPRIAV